MSGTTTRSNTKIRLRSSEQPERCTSPASPTNPYGWSRLTVRNTSTAPYPETVQLPLIQAVVNALTGHGESPSTGQSALRTARVIDSLLSDYRESHGINYGPPRSSGGGGQSL